MASLLAALRGGLTQCGQVACALQGQVAVEHKAADSEYQQSTAVTLADRLCQEIIMLRAAEEAPDLGIYGEEMAACPPEVAALFSGTSRYMLAIDPIDGTDDYIAGLPTFGHMAALLDTDSGRIEAGLAYFPRLGFGAVVHRGHGVWIFRGLHGELQRLTGGQDPAPPPTVGETKRLSVADRAAIEAAGFAMAPQASRSAIYELWRAAVGELGAVVMRHFHGHDSAVGSLIAEELGGAALTAPGTPACFDRQMSRMPLVVVSRRPEYAERLAWALAESGG
jgi:fructose-1,6-bisphosphatase/inositol monophosphatase family enzyme